MKFNLSGLILDLRGNSLKRMDGEVSIPVTFDYVITEALLAQYGDEKIEAKEKINRFRLAEKIAKEPFEVELKVEEIVLIKMLSAKVYGPNVVGRLEEILGE